MIMIVIAVHVRLVMMLRGMVLLKCVVLRPLAVLTSKITRSDSGDASQMYLNIVYHS